LEEEEGCGGVEVINMARNMIFLPDEFSHRLKAVTGELLAAKRECEELPKTKIILIFAWFARWRCLVDGKLVI